MQVFDLLTVYAIDFYSFFLPCGAFSTMYSFFLDYKCSLLCFPTETVSNYKTWQSWKMAPEIACFLLFFSPWGSLGLGRELHTFQNYTPTQIENQRFSSLCRYLLYGQNAKISWTPPALTCIPSASEELETLCWLKTNRNRLAGSPSCFCNAQCQLVFSCKQTLTCVTITISVGETKFQSPGTQMRVM